MPSHSRTANAAGWRCPDETWLAYRSVPSPGLSSRSPSGRLARASKCSRWLTLSRPDESRFRFESGALRPPGFALGAGVSRPRAHHPFTHEARRKAGFVFLLVGLAALASVLGRDTLDDHVDVLLRDTARLAQRVRERLDHLRNRLLGHAAVVELHVDASFAWDSIPQRSGLVQLLDEEPSSCVEPIAVDRLGDVEDLVGGIQTELAGEQPDIVLVVADPMRQHLHRKQDPG